MRQSPRVEGGSGGCLRGRPKKVSWELSGQEEVGWVKSGKAASGRQTLKNAWALVLPRCAEKLSWQRRPHMQRYGGRSLRCVSRKQSLMGEISQDPWSQAQKISPSPLLITWVLQSPCRFLSWGETQWDLVLGAQVGQQLTGELEGKERGPGGRNTLSEAGAHPGQGWYWPQQQPQVGPR